MSPDLQKADRAMIDARCNGTDLQRMYVMEAVDAIIDHLMKQEKHVEEPGQNAQNAQQAPSFGSWGPIETAPKDDTPVLLGWTGYGLPEVAVRDPATGGWTDYCGRNNGYFTPSHWMPLPPPPTK